MKKIFKLSVALMALITAVTSCYKTNDIDFPATIVVSGFMPTEGLPGTEVTITGSVFTNTSRVFFNETEVTEYLSRSSSQLVVVVPANASTGRIGVLDGEEYGFSDDEFTFIPAASITELSPSSGTRGSLVVIIGTNFSDIDMDQIVVKFNDAVATVSSSSTTQIAVTVPENADLGENIVTVQFGNIQTVTGPSFTVLDSE